MHSSTTECMTMNIHISSDVQSSYLSNRDWKNVFDFCLKPSIFLLDLKNN